MDQLLLETLRVVALPMKTKFRGVTVREIALFQGEYGWGEFSPFLEYDDAESAPWLACAIEAATQPKPQIFRTEIAVNGTIPALNDANQLQYFKDQGLFPVTNTALAQISSDPYVTAWTKAANTADRDEISMWSNSADLTTIVGEEVQAALLGQKAAQAAIDSMGKRLEAKMAELAKS